MQGTARSNLMTLGHVSPPANGTKWLSTWNDEAAQCPCACKAFLGQF